MAYDNKVYAAYGSNMNYAQMGDRCPKAKVLAKGFLEGYGLVFRGQGKGLGTIDKAWGQQVPIVLWEITPACERALDAYEECPEVYQQTMVSVMTRQGVVAAMAYVMTATYGRQLCAPPVDYIEGIRQGYDDNGIAHYYLDEAMRLNAEELAHFISKEAL